MANERLKMNDIFLLPAGKEVYHNDGVIERVGNGVIQEGEYLVTNVVSDDVTSDEPVIYGVFAKSVGNPNVKIAFYQSKGNACVIMPEEIKIVGKKYVELNEGIDNKLYYKGYMANVCYSWEKSVYFGKVKAMSGKKVGYFQTDDTKDIVQAFQKVVDNL